MDYLSENQEKQFCEILTESFGYPPFNNPNFNRNKIRKYDIINL